MRDGQIGRWGSKDGWGLEFGWQADGAKGRDEEWVGRQMRGKGGMRAGMGRKADEGKGRGEGGDG